ncbi:MAG TPA: 2-hydroxyacyl-CoA dehydratase family protein [Candidatus Deferrimicrobium sp.]|nr:2-hydroxyacyl-CoA dehydratase family protein [Candidatus Deferrimicrobium sp.]
MNLNELEFVQAGTTLYNAYLTKWKRDKKKVLGYYCSYAPEEIIHALGFLPFRIRGTSCQDTVLADAILSRFNCSFVKASLNLALEGQYRFLDGLITANSCDHTRRMIDIWKAKEINAKEFPHFFLSIPHVITEAGLEWIKTEMTNFKESLEKTFQVSLTDENLHNSITLFNENRELLKEIYKLRIADEPKITGSEFMSLMIANQSAPKEICNSELRNILEILKARKGTENIRARLMLVGSYVDNPDFLKIFEDVGGMLVTDALCTGVRYFWDQIETSGHPLIDIIRRYYNKMSCPRMMDQHQTRLEFIKDQVKRAKVDGVVLQRIEFCDLHGSDNMLYSHELEELNIPVLNIDREYLMSDVARFKTRIEAFIEQIMVS